MINCKNCNNKFEGNFCNICGQSSETDRIDIKFIWEDVEHGIIHYDKGIGYSLKQLLLKPGYSIYDYIAGKRINHFRPISLCIILATIYVLVYHFLGIKLISTDDSDSVKIFENILQHYYWFIFSTIPLYAITTKLVFKVKKYNFWEYFIFESFKVAQRLFVHIVFLPCFYFCEDNVLLMKIFLIVLAFLDLTLITWTNIQFFKKLKLSRVIFLSILSYIISQLLCVLILFIVLVVWFVMKETA